MKEEARDAGITLPQIDISNAVEVNYGNIRDDNFIINIWDGTGIAYAVTPKTFLLELPEETIDSFINTSGGISNGEIEKPLKMPLLDVLGRFGRCGGKYQSEDKRDMSNDFRYPHSHLAPWKLASMLLNKNPRKMIELSKQIAARIPHQFSFELIASKMEVPLDNIDMAMGLHSGATKIIQSHMDRVYNKKLKAKPKDKYR